MKPLSFFCNSILSICVVLSGITFVLSKVTQAQYLTGAAEKTDIYTGISEIASQRLTDTASRSLGVPKIAIEQTVSEIVSKEYIQSKSSQLNKQVEQVLRGESNTITVDFSDLVAQANAAGLQLNSTDIMPLEIELPANTSQTAVRSAQNLDLLRFISYSLTAIFLGISIVLAVMRRSTLGLGLAFGCSAVGFAMLALLSTVSKVAVVNLIIVPATVSELERYIDQFVLTVVSDVSSQFLTFAVIAAVLFIVLTITHRALRQLRSNKTTATEHGTPPSISNL